MEPSTASVDRPRPLTLDDLFRLRGVSDPQISPDGSRVAFVVETLDREANVKRSQIFVVDVDATETPRPLTSGTQHDTQPRWSPDGRWIAFVSDRDGTNQIYLLPLDGGEPQPIAGQPPGAQAPVWAPDSKRIAFLAPGADRAGDEPPSDERDPRKQVIRVRSHRHKLDGLGYFGPARPHVWVSDLTGEPPRQLTDGPFDDAAPAWSPDGRSIAFVSDRSPERDLRYGGGALHVVDVSTGEVRRLSPDHGRAANPSWSPDGRYIAYLGSASPDEASTAPTRLWIVSPSEGAPRCLTADLDRSIGQRPGGYLTPSPPVWSADSAALFHLVGGLDGSHQAGSTHLARFSEGDRELLTSGRLVVQTFSADRQARRFALLVTNPVTPPEVWVWDVDRGLRQLTRLNHEVLDDVALATPERIVVERADGTNVEAWLLLPPTGETRQPDRGLPLILTIHGGPHNYFGDAFSFDQQLFAANGYAVLAANPRGSGGYGEAFAAAVCQDWAGEDFHDLMAVLDHVITSAGVPIDTARLAVTGGSYGGYMTCWAVTQTNRFAAAVAGACISNLVSFFGTSDIGASWGAREFGGTPFDRWEWYLARSPLTHARNVQTPLLLYHGEADLRCPIEQSEQFFTTLHRLGKTVELLRVPGEAHGVLNGTPSHQDQLRSAILEWFTRYLGGDPTDAHS